MIAFTALALLIVGFFNSFRFSVKADKFVCGVSLFAVSGIIFWFSDRIVNLNEQVFSFLWNSSPSGDIKIDIISNSYTCGLFLPFLIITALAICGNYCFRYEEKRCRYNALLIFNLLVLLLMITSNNFVQLLSAVFLVDIFAVIKAQNTANCKNFIILNLSADMLIFMILALINGRIHSFDIREIINYKNMGYHIDLIAILGLTSVFMKMGFFPFQLGFSTLKNLRFHRLQNILYLSSPISALILLLKFSALWSASSYFLPYFDIICLTAMAFCALKAFYINNLRSKLICWHTLTLTLMLELLRFHGFVWDWRFSKILLATYALFMGLYLLYYQSGRKVLMTHLLKSKFQYFQTVTPAITIIGLAMFAHIYNLETLYNNINRYYIWTYATIFLLSFCGVLHQICFIRKKLRKNILKIQKKTTPSLFLFFAVLLCLILLVHIDLNSLAFWSMSAVFIFLYLSGLSTPLCRFYDNEKLQNLDWLNKIYRFIFVYLLQSIGIVLWFMVDRKLIENFMTKIFSGIWQLLLHFFRIIQNSYIWRCLFITLILVIALIFTPYIEELK